MDKGQRLAGCRGGWQRREIWVEREKRRQVEEQWGKPQGEMVRGHFWVGRAEEEEVDEKRVQHLPEEVGNLGSSFITLNLHRAGIWAREVAGA